MSRRIYAGGIKPLPKVNPLPCPVCGSKTRKVAVIDCNEIHFTGECRANKDHAVAIYEWPVEPDRHVWPGECLLMGFSVVNA